MYIKTMYKIKIGYIYHIINCTDDKIYVGMTFNPKKRWNAHKYDSKTGKSKLYKHMRLIGVENFSMVIVSKYILPDDNRSECVLNMFELYEIWSIDVNRILNVNSIHNCINAHERT